MNSYDPQTASRDGADTERPRKIIHIDMDAFFASVEQRDNPGLRGRPVAVGGSRERGVVAAASYEARGFGVRSAMPSLRARRLCPDLVFVPPRFDVYREVSRQIREIFAEHTPLVEPLSLDEAYLDVTENLQNLPSATEVAERIRGSILERTGLTASAGVSYNKFIAKVASDYRKPNGMHVITPRAGPSFVEDLDIGRFHGIGPATREKLNQMGVFKGRHLKALPLDLLQQRFGKAGEHYYWISRGIDRREVRPDRIRKSIGAENTFVRDLFRFDEIMEELVPLAEKTWRHCQRHEAYGRTVTLKVKYEDFQQITRSRTAPFPAEDAETILATAKELLQGVLPSEKGIRLVGVTVSGFTDQEKNADDPQLSLEL